MLKPGQRFMIAPTEGDTKPEILGHEDFEKAAKGQAVYVYDPEGYDWKKAQTIGASLASAEQLAKDVEKRLPTSFGGSADDGGIAVGGGEQTGEGGWRGAAPWRDIPNEGFTNFFAGGSWGVVRTVLNWAFDTHLTERDAPIPLRVKDPEWGAGATILSFYLPAILGAVGKGVGALRAAAARGAVETIDPALVRFSQDSVKSTFKSGAALNDSIEALRAGGAEAGAKYPPIRLVKLGGQLYSIDNRRLLVFSQARVNVPFRMATQAEIAEAFAEKKFSTTAAQAWGRFVGVRK